MTAPDVRPLSADHVEIFSPTNIYSSSLDHEPLPTQAGPARSLPVPRRFSPYSSPDAERRLHRSRSGSVLSSSSDLGSDTDIEHSPSLGLGSSPSRRSDRCIRAYNSDSSADPATPTQRIERSVYAYDSDAGVACEDQDKGEYAKKKKHDLRVSENGEQSPLFLPDVHESDSESDYIKKPPGEAGRPGRGGYSLRTSLAAWSNRTYAKVKVCDLPLIDPL